jgi:hypothetical protein
LMMVVKMMMMMNIKKRRRKFPIYLWAGNSGDYFRNPKILPARVGRLQLLVPSTSVTACRFNTTALSRITVVTCANGCPKLILVPLYWSRTCTCSVLACTITSTFLSV